MSIAKPAPSPLTLVDEEPAPPPPFSLRIHHCAISVPDLDRSINWYREILGFSVEIIGELPDGPTKGAFLRRGPVRIELFERQGAASLPEDRRSPTLDLATHGTKHMALEVDDLDAAYNHLVKHGVEIALPPFGDKMRVFFALDNSGILIEFMELRNERRGI